MPDPTLTIRPETTADYADIAAITARAFGRAAEAVVVALLRHRRAFDPTMSLVAEDEGRIVGHVMFSPPYRLRLLGTDVSAVNLAPIAVDPLMQGRGVGGALIEYGHSLARAKGYAFSFLLGHPTDSSVSWLQDARVWRVVRDGYGQRRSARRRRSPCPHRRRCAATACAVAARRKRHRFQSRPRC